MRVRGVGWPGGVGGREGGGAGAVRGEMYIIGIGGGVSASI